jgi:integrative and conjugative element protein (TIGR02256 family)
VIRIFFYPDSTRYVLFTEQALVHMYAQAQRRPWQKEAGGEFFSAEPDAAGLVITSAIGPNPRDRRSRHAWNPDTSAADLGRQAEFALGRHAVGLWHTHPEPSPSPSSLDRQTTQEYLEAFQGGRSRYLMVIIGNRGSPPAMGVWVATSEGHGGWLMLSECAAHTSISREGAAASFRLPSK